MPFGASNGTFVEADLLNKLSKTTVFGLFEQPKHSETLIFNRLLAASALNTDISLILVAAKRPS